MIEKQTGKEAAHKPAVTDGHLNFSNANSFYIYGSIDDSIPKNIVVPFIEAIDKQLLRKDPQTLHIYLSSGGGRVDYGFDLIAQIERAKDLGIPVNTYVTSNASSMASLIAVTGSERFIGARAYHLLHFPRGWEYSHNPIMSDRNNEAWQFMHKKVIEIYKTYTKIKDLETKLLPDNYIVNGAKDCIKLGLADKKIG